MEPDQQEIQLSFFHEPAKPKPGVPAEAVQIVFDHWVKKTYSRGPVPQLTDQRKKKIKMAIQTYGVDTCLDAIDGILLSDWHMGNNPQGKKYLDILVVLRNAANIERFATLKAEEGEAW